MAYPIPVSTSTTVVTETSDLRTIFATETRWNPAKLSGQPFYQVFTDFGNDKDFAGYVIGETGADGKFNYGGPVPVQTLYFHTFYGDQIYTYPPSPTPTSFNFDNPSTWVECHGSISHNSSLWYRSSCNYHNTTICTRYATYMTFATRTVPVMAAATMQARYDNLVRARAFNLLQSFDSPSIPEGAIGGIVVGIFIFVVLCFALWHRRKTTKKERAAEAEATAVDSFRERQGSFTVASAPMLSPASIPSAPTSSVTASLLVPPQVPPPGAQVVQTPSATRNGVNPTVYEHRVNLMQEEIQELREELRRRDNVVSDLPPGYSPA
ncbi:hypothetical protein DL96DRAFT_1554596 [Flagelloscypha sp. PMI_526]|nr:hypothetical protein DL96DRAFT_1554596 [Flagelloscypha sp. PMI_526]